MLCTCSIYLALSWASAGTCLAISSIEGGVPNCTTETPGKYKVPPETNFDKISGGGVRHQYFWKWILRVWMEFKSHFLILFHPWKRLVWGNDMFHQLEYFILASKALCYSDLASISILASYSYLEYSWPLTNTGLNCRGSTFLLINISLVLFTGFTPTDSTNHRSRFPSAVGWLPSWGIQDMAGWLCYSILPKELELCGQWFRGILQPFHCGYRELTRVPLF